MKTRRFHRRALLQGTTAWVAFASLGGCAEDGDSAGSDAVEADVSDSPDAADVFVPNDTVREDGSLNPDLEARIEAARPNATAYFNDANLDDLGSVSARYVEEELDLVASGQDSTLESALDSVLDASETSEDVETAKAAFLELVRADFAALVVADVGGWTMGPVELVLAAIATGEL